MLKSTAFRTADAPRASGRKRHSARIHRVIRERIFQSVIPATDAVKQP
jgi:hypothetical protein